MPKIAVLPLADPIQGDEDVVLVQDGVTKRAATNDYLAAAVTDATSDATAAATSAENSATAALALSNFRSTLAQGVADFAVGVFFASAETGQLRVYERIAAAPQYQDAGDALAPLTRALMAASGGAGVVGHVDDTAVLSGAQAMTVQDALRSDNRISLLRVLTPAERADVLAGTNAIDLTAKLAQLFADVHAHRPGAVIDASMWRGTVTWTANPWAALTGGCKATLVTGAVTIEKNFNAGPLTLPSHFNWVSLTDTVVRASSEITASLGGPGHGMVQTPVLMTLATGVAAANSVTVAYPSGINVGALVAIDGAEEDPFISHTIAAAIDADDMAVTFNEDISSTIGGSLVYLKIDNEILYGIVSGATFNVSQRGALGTSAAAHAEDATARLMKSFFSHITAIAGSVLTLDDALPRSFTNAYISVGAVGGGIHGRWTLDGRYDRVDTSRFFHGLSLPLARGFRTSGGGINIRNVPAGGLTLFAARDCVVELDEVRFVGKPAVGLGGDIWCYGAAKRNVIRCRSGRQGYCAWYIDYKSNGHFLLDGLAEDNRIEIGSITDGYILEGQISGGRGNTVNLGYADTTTSSVILDHSTPQTAINATCELNSIVTNAQKTLRAPTGDAAGNNLVSFNGRSVRRVSVTLTIGAGGITVVANTNYAYASSAAGVKAGDRIFVKPAVLLANATPVFGYSVADDVVRLIFTATNADAVIADGTQFIVDAEGPW